MPEICAWMVALHATIHGGMTLGQPQKRERETPGGKKPRLTRAHDTHMAEEDLDLHVSNYGADDVLFTHEPSLYVDVEGKPVDTYFPNGVTATDATDLLGEAGALLVEGYHMGTIKQSRRGSISMVSGRLPNRRIPLDHSDDASHGLSRTSALPCVITQSTTEMSTILLCQRAEPP